MTYSTCSFHPVENEAVVAALLRTGTVEIVPQPSEPLWWDLRIVARPGLTSWKVLDDACKELPWRDDQDKVKDSKLSAASNRLPKTLWPPAEKEIVESLRHCIRLLPHDNDTGGFFIAVLRKVRDFPTTTTDDNEKEIKGEDDARLGRIRRPLVTPIAPHHRLYPVRAHPLDCNHNYYYYKRSPKTNDDVGSSGGGKTFSISSALAKHLAGSPESDKLNVVYAGHRERKKKRGG